MSTATTADDRPTVRWLHLTDLHIGKNDESQKTALVSLLTAIKDVAAGRVFDFVLLTGDLAFSGNRQEYDDLRRILIDPLRATSLCERARFLATPGNHDIDCDVGYPPVWASLGHSRQETFFHLGEAGRKARSIRAQAFQEYSEFVRRASIESVDPTNEPAILINAVTKNRNLAFISAVTAFFSDKEVNDRQRTPAPCHPLRTILQELPSTAQPIILGHHPPEWFTPETERHLHSLLVEYKALYLHGHDHRVKSKFGVRGLTSLGFGAAYQASHDSPPTPYYRNSFAVCELGDLLHIAVTSWDSENGRWRPEQQLPADFFERSSLLPDGYRLPLASSHAQEQDRPYISIATALRSEIRIESCIWLAENAAKRWADLLVTIGAVRNVAETYNLPTQTLPAGHSQFRIKDQTGNNLVRGVSGHGDVLNYEQLQALNTELDRQDYDACIIATLGELASDAKILAAQLASRKALTVLERTDIVRRALRNLPPGLEKALFTADPKRLSGSLVITQTGFAMIFQERTTGAWFQVVGDDGHVLPESAALVKAVRQELPFLRTVRYEVPQRTQGELALPSSTGPAFDRAKYLEACRSYFDDVKYAPLAALGFRFRKASLSDIYVDASADVGGTTKSTHNLTRAVTEFIDSLNLPQAQREQLESQLRSRYGLNRTAEVGAAGRLYQRYNNVVVLGDPGSGKTCFVQHEILEYCDSPDESGWYSQHLPIYVSLAEAARLLDTDTHLLDICSIVSSRRGIDLPKEVIERALSDGRAAFFFDGLDEVGYIDKRIALLGEIDNLVKTFAPKGNRFVLTSRPAAVQPVEIPDTLTFLNLRGLTEDEIRTLAGRVLTVRLSEGEAKTLSAEEVELIDRLLDDTRNSPGIARIARNPLLLTLLVLIYANTGALSARRHVIYTQAIKTLVSVRGRQTREQQISESDLRTRLGALALSIFRRDIAEIPTRSEALTVLTPLVRQPTKEENRTQAECADSFIQEVAEATGLLTIHSREEENSEDLVTFMHYSFLEYYSAAGLLSRDFQSAVSAVAANPRWRDVITLLFGILSEQSDITPLLRKLLLDTSPAEEITKYKLLLGLDCASECDVPPEESQDLLAEAIYEAVANGPARFSVTLREEIARKLEYFVDGAGPRIVRAVSRGLRHQNPLSAAAFADLIARLGESVVLPKDLTDAFGECLMHEHPVTRAACLLAVELRRELRTEEAKNVVKRSLKGTLVEKHAALKVIAAVPSFQDIAGEEVRDLLDDPNPFIAGVAAQVILAGAFKGEDWMAPAALMEKVVLKLGQSTQDSDAILAGITLDRETVQRLVFSSDPVKSELAIRYVSLIRDNDQFVHQILMQRMRTSETPRHKAACLDALRVRPSAIQLLTIADIDLICSQLEIADKSVRMAAIRLLGEMPDDEQVVSSLQTHLKGAAENEREEEVTEVAKSLAKHVRRNEKLRTAVLTAVIEHLPRSADSGFGNEANQQHILGLLLVCESIGEPNEKAARRLGALADDYRTPIAIRRQAMRVFGKISEPAKESVELFSNLLGRNDPRVNDMIYGAVQSFVSQSRRKVEYVRRVYGSLPALRDRLCEAWNREVSRSPESIEPVGLRDLRDAVVEINNLMVAYDEFSNRTMLTQQNSAV